MTSKCNEFDKSLEDLSKSVAGQQDIIIYRAAKQGAEAVAFINEVETENISDYEISFQQKYLICDNILELRGLSSMGKKYSYIEIPAYMHRIAEKATDYHDFIDILEREHIDFENFLNNKMKTNM